MKYKFEVDNKTLTIDLVRDGDMDFWNIYIGVKDIGYFRLEFDGYPNKNDLKDVELKDNLDSLCDLNEYNGVGIS